MREPAREIDANLASPSLLNQAFVHHQSGRLVEAEQLYQRILKQQPTHLDTLHNLGTIACQSQKFDRAINYFQQALTHAPQRLDTHTNLAHALKAMGNLPEAIKHYEIILEASPDLADIHFNLGQLLATQERLDEAIAHFQRTIDIQPHNTQAYLSLSDVAISQQQLDIARSSLEKAIEIQPDCADAYWNLCALMRQTDDYQLWRQTAEKYVQFCELSDPMGSEIALIQAYYKTGMHSEALKKLEELELKIYRDVNIISEKDIGRIYFLILFAIVRLRDDLELNSKLAKLIGPLYAQNAQNTLAKLPNQIRHSFSSDRRKSHTVANSDIQRNQLRIGFISVNFRRHPVGWCSTDTIAALAKLTPHIYLYASSKFVQDDRTQVFEAIAYKCNWQGARWQQQQESETFNNLSDLIAEIEQDHLDVLIDLDSLTASRHPEILIRKPAHLCISWLGFDAPYLCSDNYNLGDRHTHPLGLEDYYIEKTLRLPDSHMAVTGFPSVQIDGKVQRKSLKLRIKDIIYLCVTPSIKLNLATVEAHIQILKSVPNSLLLYKGRGDLDIVKSLYDQVCTAQRLDPKRIKFLPLTHTEEEHRSVYALADVLLDSYPYNGGSHTMEALWFDLPIVTRLGKQSFARMGYSFLTTLGITAGIAQTWDEYVQWGIRLGEDKALRNSIKAQLAKSKQPEHLSPLWNPTKLAEDMYSIFMRILEEQGALDPEHEFEMGNRLWQSGKIEAAAKHYQQAIALQPNHAEAWGNLGVVLHGQNKLDEAIAHYQKSLQLNPVNFAMQSNLGKVLRENGNDRDAIECYKKAIDIDPSKLNPHNRLGDILLSQNNLDRAFACFQRAIEIEPTYAFSHSRLGCIHLEWNQVDLAIACFRRSIHHDPEYANAHVNLGIALLMKGEYSEGFLEYEWRWRSTDIPNPIPNFPQPFLQLLWDGRNFSGQTLLIYAEQGLGDSIQFIRYIPLVRELAGEHGRILFDCPESLMDLFSQIPGISLVNCQTSLPDFDLRAPLLSLPHILGTRLESIPSTIPYLFNPSDRLIKLDELAKSTPNQLRIGIVWATCSANTNIRKRSCSLQVFRQIVDCIDSRQAIFYSLQKEIPAEEIELLGNMVDQIIDMSGGTHPGGNRINNFADTASIIAQMDLVISIDTSVAHLAGAMGKPVWVILPFSPDWRWMLERDDSPWYPTMRLFRQKNVGDWTGVIRMVVKAMRDFKHGDVTPQLDFDALLQSAIAHQVAGRLDEAAQIYQQILQEQPDNFNALYLAGVIAWRQGNLTDAITQLQQTIALKQDHAEAHKKLGDVWKQQSRDEEAIACYQHAITHKPNYCDAHYNLGVLFRKQGNLSQATSHYQQIIAIKPDYAEAYGNLGVVLYEDGKIAEAIATYRQCLELNSHNVMMLCNLAVALCVDGQCNEAITHCQSALQIEPNSQLALYNLAYIYQTQENIETAIATYQRVIELNPNYTDAYIAQGHIYSNLKQYEKAVVEFQNAIAVEPSSSNAMNWLGFVHLELNQVEPAIAAFKQAIACDPDYAEAHMNLGLALLISGNYTEGLAEYEWRSRRSGLDKSSPHFFPHPLWDGNDLQGQTILVFGEQGFGDLIQFIRYIPLIKARAGENCKLIFDCQSSLKRLFSNVIDLHLAPRDIPLPAFDVRISLLSLPYLLGTTLETIPTTVPYLSIAEDINLEAIQKISDHPAQLKVGLVWASKQTHSTAPKRSCHLTSLLPLLDRFELQDIHFYGLQKEISDADRQLISQQHLKLTDLSDFLGDFADTAAIINHLDLLITVDTSVAHLAGALGKPAWILLPFAPDWRWMLDREDSPWYPTIRLFRQTQIDDWESVIKRLANALSSLITRNSINPDVNILLQSAIQFQTEGNLIEAEKIYHQILQQQPENFNASYLLGIVVYCQDKLTEAIEYFQRTIGVMPNHAEAHKKLGDVFSSQRKTEEAIAYYQAACKIKPDYVAAHYQCANILANQAETEEALKHYQQVLRYQPNHAIAIRMQLLMLPAIYTSEAEIIHWRQRFNAGLQEFIRQSNIGLEIEAERLQIIKALAINTNFYLAYQGKNDLMLQCQYGNLLHQAISAQYPQWAQDLTMLPLSQDRKIRVGYISAYLGNHAATRWLMGWLRYRDRSKFEISCYFIGENSDPLTQQFQQESDHFHHIHTSNEAIAAICEQIYADRLHVLVFADIGMHPPSSLIAGLRLAPVQCAGWGHPVSTGIPTIDYFLSSEQMEPVNGESHYSEKLVRLPQLGVSYLKPNIPVASKSRSDFRISKDSVVYLCSQALFKYLPQHDFIFVRIAQAIPHAKFVFFYNDSVHTTITEKFRQRLARAFADIDLMIEQYCIFMPRLDFDTYLNLNLISDIFLDTLDFSGGNTTLDAIACGLPIVTLPGEFMRGRHSYAMLKILEVEETIAYTEAEYIEIAIKLGKDPNWRQSIVKRMSDRHNHLYDDQLSVRALEEFYQSVTEVPDLSKLFTEARVHHLAGELKEAKTQYRRILQHQPHHDEAWHMLGVIDLQSDSLQDAYRRLERASISIQKALEINPQNVEAHSNLGYCHSLLGNIENAIAHYREAIALDPDFVDAHKNLGLALLTLGDFKQGFIEYEWRWQSTTFQQGNLMPPFSLWNGEDLLDRTLLLYCEQGLGDALQFSRYIPLILARGGKIMIDCPELLGSLFGEIEGANIAKPNTPLRKGDLCIPLMSLPRVFGTTLETIPAQIPYLSVPSQARANLNLDIFNSSNQFKVGIVWASKIDHATSRDRSCPLAKLKPLLDIPEISFYSLQKEISTQDREIFDGLLQQYPENLCDLGDCLHDFADTAAIVEQLDLIISVDTAVAHLAGALGKPTWVLLPFVADWRWMLDREDSPWYPTMRLFRQQKAGDWQEVIDKVTKALVALADPMLPKSPSPPHNTTQIGIGWPIGSPTGWGTFGLNLALQILTTKEFKPFLLVESGRGEGFINPLHQKLFESAIAKQQEIQKIIAQNPGKVIQLDIPILHALSNSTLKSTQPHLKGKYNFGYIFFESGYFSPEAINTARAYDLIFAGSQWNADKLKSYGLTNICPLIQGIDPTIFHPAPRSNLFGDRFVVFSGGKLEYRKGQDIVVAAFKIFQTRHPDALLLSAWHNFWSQFMQGIDQSRNVVGLPTIGPQGKLEITKWLIDNGLPIESFIDLGLIPNHIAPQIMREADVALFPNRCEGGTNLVAMECLACGIPTILSANTGHLDLISDHHCYPLNNQKQVRPHPQFSSVEDWGESDVNEVVEILERVYGDREEAKGKGQAAAEFMQDLTWEKQVNRILTAINSKILSSNL